MILFESVSLKDTIPCDSMHFGENRFKIKKGWSGSGCTGKDAGNGMKRERQDADMAALFEAILVLKTPEECHAFFKDLCTYQDLNAISQRLQVAKLLHEGHVFHDIVEETGASTATISRVNRVIKDGCNGYQLIFDRVYDKKEES